MRRLMLMVLASTCAVSSPGAQAPAVPQSQIDAAIDRGIAYLLDAYQDGEGRDPRAKPGEPTTLTEPPGLRALTTYALLKSGVSGRNPVVEKLVSRLAFERLSANYDVSCMLLALVALDPVAERNWIGDLAAYLVKHQEVAGDFGYPNGGDLSNTQFVAFALHSAASAGITIEPKVWKDLAHSVMRYHAKDGGFGYMAGTPSTNTMTAAGVGVLAICEIELARANELEPALAQTIRRGRAAGLSWLARLPAYGGDSDHSGWLHYFLYGLERVGDLSTIETIGNHNWYDEGASYLVESQDDRGAWHGTYERVPTLFALLFLSRANAVVRTGERFAPRTGPMPRPFQHTAGTDVVGGARLEAEGTRPLRMWVTRLSSPANAAFEWPEERGRGPHVAFVEFLVDDVIVDVALGDPERPAGDRRFACEHTGTAPGHHRLTARIHVCQPEARGANGQRSAHGAGEKSAAHEDEIITTNGVEMDVDEGTPVAIVEKSFDPEVDLMLIGHAHATASSTLANVSGWDEGFSARFVVDGNPRSVWIAAQEDEHPILKLRLQEPQRANVVRIAVGTLEPRTPDFLNLPQELSVSIDGAAAKTIAIESSTRLWYELKLDGRRMVSSVEVRLNGRQARNASVGIGEVALLLEPK